MVLCFIIDRFKMPYAAKKGKGKASSSKVKTNDRDDIIINAIFETNNGDMKNITDIAGGF